ncbi:hypothetical protein E2I15_19420 [Bradyrhizobium sp. BR2003]|nr:hypothetical protein [Bradyrhizobium sp. BR2003]
MGEGGDHRTHRGAAHTLACLGQIGLSSPPRLHDVVSVIHFKVGIIKARFMALVAAHLQASSFVTNPTTTS